MTLAWIILLVVLVVAAFIAGYFVGRRAGSLSSGRVVVLPPKPEYENPSKWSR